MLKYNTTIMLTPSGYWLKPVDDPYNPLELPPHTIRVRFTSGVTPTNGDTQTLVDAGNNIWDIYKASDDWQNLFYRSEDLLEVLGANTTGITIMTGMFMFCSSLTTVPLFDTSSNRGVYEMFYNCSSLTSVPLFDTSNVTYMAKMFEGCSALTSVPLFDTSSATSMEEMFTGCRSLTSVPLFDTSNVTDMDYMLQSCELLTSIPLFDTSKVVSMNGMCSRCRALKSVPLFDTSSAVHMVETFYNCYNVESGALALYQQASTQATPPRDHDRCFTNCGRDTVTGAAELAQIDIYWGGTAT